MDYVSHDIGMRWNKKQYGFDDMLSIIGAVWVIMVGPMGAVRHVEGTACKNVMKTDINLYAKYHKQNLSSPNYPKKYNGNTLCRWRIHSETNDDQIRLEIKDSHIQNSRPCSKDYLEVKDGAHIWDYTVKRWCGSYTPPGVFRSSGQDLLVTFRVDNENNYRGFTMIYWKEPRPLRLYSPPEYRTTNIILFLVSGVALLSFLLSFLFLLLRSYKIAPPCFISKRLQTHVHSTSVYQRHVDEESASTELSLTTTTACT